MPSRPWEIRIRDILAAIERIEAYTRGMDAVAFAKDERTLQAVAFNLALIGEAASRIPPDAVKSHPSIPWAKMKGMRNVIIHEYFGIEPAILWETIFSEPPGDQGPSSGDAAGQSLESGERN